MENIFLSKKIDFFKYAIDKNPNNPFNYINLGNLYISSGNLTKARDIYLEALDLSNSKDMFNEIKSKLSLLEDNSSYKYKLMNDDEVPYFSLYKDRKFVNNFSYFPNHEEDFIYINEELNLMSEGLYISPIIKLEEKVFKLKAIDIDVYALYKRIVVKLPDKIAYVWDLETSKLIGEINIPNNHYIICSSGKLIVLPFDGGLVRIFSLLNLDIISDFKKGDKDEVDIKNNLIYKINKLKNQISVVDLTNI